MPYIKKEDREKFDLSSCSLPTNAGELNYLITVIVHQYITLNGLNYQKLNDVVGALDGAKVEFQRRVVAPYEDSKIKENGDV